MWRAPTPASTLNSTPMRCHRAPKTSDEKGILSGGRLRSAAKSVTHLVPTHGLTTTSVSLVAGLISGSEGLGRRLTLHRSRKRRESDDRAYQRTGPEPVPFAHITLLSLHPIASRVLWQGSNEAGENNSLKCWCSARRTL